MVGVLAATRVGVALRTQPGPMEPVGNPGLGLLGAAVSAFLTTLLVGAVLIALAPGYTERLMATVRAEPAGSFVYGVVALAALVLVTILLFVTLVGIVVAIPLALLAIVVWAIGAAVAYLAIGERLIGSEDGWLKPLLVGAAINGGLALTGIGGIVAFCIGAAGFGAVLRTRFG